MTAAFPQFDPDFSSPSDWAAMYRLDGLQIVPAKMPANGKQWKMPALTGWAEFQENLIPDAVFLRWYGQGGEHVARQNMGILTGRCSGNVFVLDLDVHKSPAAGEWWHNTLELHNNGIEPETVQQRTGGGGRQLLFRAPSDWLAPTNRTNIGVDIRGQGGFAVMPPSRHESGSDYGWEIGSAPWEIEIAAAPDWLLEAIETLIARHGSRPKGVKTASPNTDKDAFGRVINGRESFMSRKIWHGILELYRTSQIPFEHDFEKTREELWTVYEREVATRLEPRRDASQLPLQSNAELLEIEHRGYGLFYNKWRREVRNWGSVKMREAAAKPKPEPELDKSGPVNNGINGPLSPLSIQTSAQFVANFTPPAYLIDGILQRGYIYSLTAKTGHGKTAVTMYIAQCIARGQQMHWRNVLSGTVLILAGENPDDVRARFMVLAKHYAFDVDQIKIRWIAGIIKIADCLDRIRAEAEAIEDLVLVLVDTAAAYFPGIEPNNNAEQGNYARLLRELTFLRNKPAVLVNCHPVKNATRDNLVPMGGSAFLNEVDGNLTLWATADKRTTLHWQGKFRGPELNPISFEMIPADSPKVVDAEGRMLKSVVARPLSDEEIVSAEQETERVEDRLMHEIWKNKRASVSDLAARIGSPNTTTWRLLSSLKEDKLVELFRRRYRLTNKGKEAIGIGVGKNEDFG